MRRQMAPMTIEQVWYGTGVAGHPVSAVPTVPNPPRVAWVQHPTQRDHWLTAVRKPEHAPAGSTVTLLRKRA